MAESILSTPERPARPSTEGCASALPRGLDGDDWRGLHVSSTSPLNVPHDVEVARGGGGAGACSGAALMLANGGRLVLKNAYIHHGESHGIDSKRGVMLTFAKSTLEANKDGSVRLECENVGSLDATSNYGDPTKGRVRVTCKAARTCGTS